MSQLYKSKNDIPENFDELVLYQKELRQEEEFLKITLLKIEKQIHALQVERMHLINSMNKNDTDKNNSIDSKIEISQECKANTKEVSVVQISDKCNSNVNLNLNISPLYQYDDEEESDDDDDNDDDEDEYII